MIIHVKMLGVYLAYSAGWDITFYALLDTFTLLSVCNRFKVEPRADSLKVLRTLKGRCLCFYSKSLCKFSIDERTAGARQSIL
ncbi:hypothetical protein L6164_025969 [Bauhinia variegata]|uniref:Uncharacterized protein n=1 Tax=Bauhinia variegata TaxID=167791 RepID=A0ACB9M5B5_BAUVA|nr:hypothetical protein L6164_025969 [Bauhinia variegata]